MQQAAMDALQHVLEQPKAVETQGSFALMRLILESDVIGESVVVR